MIKLLRTLLKNARSDSGDSLVTALIVFPLVVSLLVTGIDFGVFLNNKSYITNAAREGARTVAILGGNGSNDISDKYGKPASLATCAGMSNVECDLYLTLDSAPLVQATLENGDPKTDIKCTPNKTSYVGEQVSCTVKWRYKGLPMSSLSLVSLGDEKNGAEIDGTTGNALGFTQSTTGYANAETSTR